MSRNVPQMAVTNCKRLGKACGTSENRMSRMRDIMSRKEIP